MIKIAFFGTGNFSRNILNEILKNEKMNVELVISQPDKKVGRKQEIEETPVKILAIEKNIEVLQPQRLKDNTELVSKLKNLNLDFLVVVAYGKIIPKDILDIPKYFPINIHGSILPKYRGASPIQESIKNGDTETGLTIMKMSEGMDEGEILNIQKVEINIKDKTQDIFNKFELFGAELLITTLEDIINNKIEGIPQNNIEATYCSKIEKGDGEINFNKEDSLTIYNKFRAYSNWPGIFTYYNGKKLSIEDCFFNLNESGIKIGSLIKQENGEIGIKCKSGFLIIKKIKLEGKKEMDIKDFMNGNKEFMNYIFN